MVGRIDLNDIGYSNRGPVRARSNTVRKIVTRSALAIEVRPVQTFRCRCKKTSAFIARVVVVCTAPDIPQRFPPRGVNHIHRRCKYDAIWPSQELRYCVVIDIVGLVFQNGNFPFNVLGRVCRDAPRVQSRTSLDQSSPQSIGIVRSHCLAASTRLRADVQTLRQSLPSSIGGNLHSPALAAARLRYITRTECSGLHNMERSLRIDNLQIVARVEKGSPGLRGACTELYVRRPGRSSDRGG